MNGYGSAKFSSTKYVRQWRIATGAKTACKATRFRMSVAFHRHASFIELSRWQPVGRIRFALRPPVVDRPSWDATGPGTALHIGCYAIGLPKCIGRGETELQGTTASSRLAISSSARFAIVLRPQSHPELGAVAEEAGQEQCGFGGDGASAIVVWCSR